MNTRNTPTVVHIDTRRARPPRLSEAELDALIRANRDRSSTDAANYGRRCNLNCVQGRTCDCVPDVPADAVADVTAQRRARRWCGALLVFWAVAIFVVVAVFGTPVAPPR